MLLDYLEATRRWYWQAALQVMHRKAWEIYPCGKQQNPLLNCNSEEADTRVWLHTFRSPGSKKLLYSPDTDVYHIGLALLGRYPQSDVFIQLSAISSPEKKLLHLNSLCNSLSGDLDLAIIPSEIHPKVLQALFVCTGCDYISFFAGLGKATFLRNFFQHANGDGDDGDGNANGKIYM